jgi:CRISPR/Cas system-associated exonuclease Cas4 (RecB family)
MGEKKIKIPDDPKIRSGFTAFMEYQAKMKVKWLESERIVYSKKYGYVGTADAIGKIGKDLILFDFKSSKPSTMSPDGIYPEHAIQTSGYQLAYEEEMKKKISYRIIIALNKETGEFRFRIFDNNDSDKEAFLAALTLRRRIDEIK